MPRITREEERLAGVIDRLRRDEGAARDNAWRQHQGWMNAENRFINAPRAEVVTATELREIALNFARGRRVGRGKNCTRKRRKKRRKRKKSGRGPALRLVKQSIQRSKTRKLNKLIKKIRRRGPSRKKNTRKIPSAFTHYGPEDHYKPPVGRPNPWAIKKKSKK